MVARMPTVFDVIAIDLDGTFLGPGSALLERNVEAVKRARAEGVRVIFCTGRGLAESRFAYEACGPDDLVVVAGGAIVSDPATGETVHRFAMDAELVEEAVARLLELDHPAMVLKDPAAAGYDYLVVNGHKRLSLDSVTEWWFSEMDVTARFCEDLARDGHPEHTVRVGACARAATLAPIKGVLEESFGKRAMIQHFKAVVAPDRVQDQVAFSGQAAEGEEVHILEVFDARAHKWNALKWILDRDGIDPSRVLAIGDEINDVTMLRGAGMGVAMGNAVAAAREAADAETAANHLGGVADAIERALAGGW